MKALPENRSEFADDPVAVASHLLPNKALPLTLPRTSRDFQLLAAGLGATGAGQSVRREPTPHPVGQGFELAEVVGRPSRQVWGGLRLGRQGFGTR